MAMTKTKVIAYSIAIYLSIFILSMLSISFYNVDDKVRLINQVSNLKEQKQQLKNQVVKENGDLASIRTKIELLEREIDGDDVVYILDLEVKQSHFSLDIGEHMKDSLNKFEMPIEVSRELYHSVKAGENLYKGFRAGSLLMKGSIGNWNVTVKKRYTK